MALRYLLALLAGLLAVLWVATLVLTRRAEKAFPPRGRFVDAEGVRLHYLEAGTGPDLVLLHGDAGSVYDFTLSPLVEMLARDHHAVAFDRPGFGYSTRARDASGPAAQARLLRAAADALGLTSPVLVGHGHGATVCLAWALDYTEDVTGVVAIAADAYGDGAGPAFFDLLAAPVLGPLLAHTIGVPFGRPAVTRDLRAAFYPDTWPPTGYAASRVSLGLRPRQLLARAEEVVRGMPSMRELAARYRAIRFPLVCVHGAEDGEVPVDWSERLHHEVPDSALVVIPKSGHEVPFNHPEAIVEAVRTAEALGAGRARRH